jgi:hypothetical protein
MSTKEEKLDKEIKTFEGKGLWKNGTTLSSQGWEEC